MLSSEHSSLLFLSLQVDIFVFSFLTEIQKMDGFFNDRVLYFMVKRSICTKTRALIDFNQAAFQFVIKNNVKAEKLETD